MCHQLFYIKPPLKQENIVNSSFPCPHVQSAQDAVQDPW